MSFFGELEKAPFDDSATIQHFKHSPYIILKNRYKYLFFYEINLIGLT